MTKARCAAAAFFVALGGATLAQQPAASRSGTGLTVGTQIQVQMNASVSSATQKNGDTVEGTLAAPLRTGNGQTLPRGSKVEATVVSSAKAGMVQSGGVLSLQLVRVGPLPVISDVLDFEGQEGHKDVADSAPAKGTEATLAAGAMLSFHVLENGHATGLAPGATPADAQGGAGATQTHSPAGAPRPATGTSTGTPSTEPGANQRPVGGATQGVTPPGAPK